jgi:hypothetical protein
MPTLHAALRLPRTGAAARRPVLPVCERSSGNALRSSSCENRNAGSKGMPSRPPFALCRSGFDLGVLVEKPTRVLAENARLAPTPIASSMRAVIVSIIV